MATALELLSNEDCDDILVVDLESRRIIIPNTVENLGVESDDSVRVLHFQVPRQYCEVDLSEFSIRINFKNTSGAGGSYDVSDATIEDDMIKFDWLVERPVTVRRGNVVFNVCFREIIDDVVEREFNTAIASLAVLEGLQIDDNYDNDDDQDYDDGGYYEDDESSTKAVRYVPQTLSYMEKLQARSNIDAGDGLEVDFSDNKLYLLSAGKRISDGIELPAGGGGAIGGGTVSNAVMTIKNTSGWIYKTLVEGAECPISFTWNSIENEMETGPGTLQISVNGTVKYQANIEQGDKTLDISKYLISGSNKVRVAVTDVYGTERPIIITIDIVALSITSQFDGTAVQMGSFQYFYTPTGAVAKTVYFIMDGTEIGKETVTTSGRQQFFTVPAQSHGAHTFEVYFTADINGDEVPSNRLKYSIVCTELGNNRPIIAFELWDTNVEQFGNISIPWRVYVPNSMTADVVLSAPDQDEDKPLTVDRTVQTWSYRPDTVGSQELKITCGKVTETLVLTVAESKLDVEAETENLSLYLTSYGRSNNEANPGVWSHGDISANLTNFNYTSDGWMTDDDGITVLRVSGDARVEIPIHIFAQDFRTTGKTIEIEFASRSVLDYDAVLATCLSNGRGFEITAQQATLKSEKSNVTTRYKEDDHLRLGFVIEKRNGNRLIISYVNGIISGMVQYPDADDFSQGVAATISLGSNDCTLDVYNIRVYDSDLNRFQMLDNWIADTQDLSEKKDRYDRNDIFDGYGRILPSTLRPHQCYLVINCPVLPTHKEDVKICSGYYVDPVHQERSFSFTDAEIDVQGTSSQYYYVKNFKIKFKNGFTMTVSQTTVETYAMNDKAVPTDEFTFKADVASSEGANNVILAELYNELCPVKTPAQETDPRVRQTIEGHPIVIFHDDGNGAKFIGKYNFNNDKSTPEVFGFAEGDESWEIKENGNAQVSFKTDDFTDWQTSFEGRYPKKNTDITRLRQFVSWIASTDTGAVSTDAEKQERLNKFKNEVGQWADVEDAIFYYLFTLIFLCIDQREKNAFPTYNAEMAKWLWLFYDADSSLGTDNKGKLTFEYWMEDIDYTEAGEPVFNGQNNVFWSNLRVCFADEIKAEYRRLRTQIAADGKPLLSYDRVNDLFIAHQSQWSEAIYNEDAWRKAVEPLEQANDPQYLPMQQGKKEQHFKHWMYNRFRYLDSKFETGAALDDENRIMMRAHAQGNIFLTSYINMYGQVYFNSAFDEHRMMRDTEYEFVWKAQGAEDAVIGVNSAPMITNLGDLSPLMLEYCHIQYASHLTELKVGAGGDYKNGNFVALTLGNNKLLRKLDVRNCFALTQEVDASGCTNIEEVYFDGTSIVGLSLPNGGILKKLHLPGTITDLTLRNQTKLTEFVLPGYSEITTLRLENVGSIVPGREILAAMPATSRVRMIGFDWSFDSIDDALAFCDRLDTMRGLDEKGENVDKPQMAGTIRVDSLTGAQLASIQSRYPDIKVVYQHITSYLYIYNEDGSSVLQIVAIQDGADGSYTGSTPTKASTAQYTYTFAGWSLTPGGEVDEDALKAVAADRSVYAAFTATLRKYTVYWKNGSTTLETDTNVPYGTVPTYNGSTPAYTGSGDAADYEFSGWSPAVKAITGDTTYTAQFKYTGYVSVQLIEKSISGDYENKTATAVGNYAFEDCDSLRSVYFQAATSVGAGAFENCGALKKAAFVKQISIGSSAFMNSELDTLLLHSETMCSLSQSNAFDGTPIANGTGYIYVPAALIDSYKTGGVWSNYASQFRTFEDYPELADKYSWSTVFASIDDGTYATKYAIGDAIPLDLGSEGVVNMQIAAFDTDNLADGSGKAKITWIAKEPLKTAKSMNPSLEENYIYPEVASWTASGNTWTSQNRYTVSDAKASWNIAVTEAGTLTISYKTLFSNASRNKISVIVNGEAVATDYVNSTASTYSMDVAVGDTITVMAVYSSLTAKYDQCGTVTFGGTGAFTTEATIDNAPRRVADGYIEGTGTIGGWEKCDMRTYLKDTIKPLIAENVASRIATVTKTQPATDAAWTEFNQTTTDDVWIPSLDELLSGGAYVLLFPDNNSRRSSDSRWLRSTSYKENWDYIEYSGSLMRYGNAPVGYKICLCFCTN